jgi:(p)ppGpp synthase/HD superfamily hydrolase
MSTLERAIVIAAESHAGQTDKAGAPYVLHPLRVMLRVASNDARIVAVLHDVIEDCGVTPERLRAEGFSETVIRALGAVTRAPGETYEDFVLRAAADPIGRQVKLADLRDNSDPSRISEPTGKDAARMEKYRRAIATLLALHPDLAGGSGS